jgi:hypothetical protein
MALYGSRAAKKSQENRRAQQAAGREELRQGVLLAGGSPEQAEAAARAAWEISHNYNSPGPMRVAEANLKEYGQAGAAVLATAGTVAQGYPGIGTVIGAACLAGAAGLNYGATVAKAEASELEKNRTTLSAVASEVAAGCPIVSEDLLSAAAAAGGMQYTPDVRGADAVYLEGMLKEEAALELKRRFSALSDSEKAYFEDLQGRIQAVRARLNSPQESAPSVEPLVTPTGAPMEAPPSVVPGGFMVRVLAALAAVKAALIEKVQAWRRPKLN